MLDDWSRWYQVTTTARVSLGTAGRQTTDAIAALEERRKTTQWMRNALLCRAMKRGVL